MPSINEPSSGEGAQAAPSTTAATSSSANTTLHEPPIVVTNDNEEPAVSCTAPPSLIPARPYKPFARVPVEPAALRACAKAALARVKYMVELIQEEIDEIPYRGETVVELANECEVDCYVIRKMNVASTRL